MVIGTFIYFSSDQS